MRSIDGFALALVIRIFLALALQLVLALALQLVLALALQFVLVHRTVLARGAEQIGTPRCERVVAASLHNVDNGRRVTLTLSE